MAVKIRYFGSLKETLGLTEEQLEWNATTSDELLRQLRARGKVWQEALAENNIFRLVVNQQIIYQPVAIYEGDEVAILPPVTGG